MQVFTIGLTKKSAAEFFGTLHHAGVKRVLDIRLNNVSQLAGFTKRDDLAYFLDAIAGIGYVHPELEIRPKSKSKAPKQKASSRFAELDTRWRDAWLECGYPATKRTSRRKWSGGFQF